MRTAFWPFLVAISESASANNGPDHATFKSHHSFILFFLIGNRTVLKDSENYKKTEDTRTKPNQYRYKSFIPNTEDAAFYIISGLYSNFLSFYLHVTKIEWAKPKAIWQDVKNQPKDWKLKTLNPFKVQRAHKNKMMMIKIFTIWKGSFRDENKSIFGV